jgi:non-specific serine/threonine protein kinase
MKVYCPLSRAQIALYQDAVASLALEIEGSSEIKRRGVVLAYLMRFKQICNHPSLMLKEGVFSAKDSGKFQQLKEICEIIASKQEKVLIFTQFKGMTEPIAEFLTDIFGEAGLVLHGDTPIKKRMELVENFQKANGPPFFVLSLKAGGTGLNLTAASHVIHFDRWWNPATENQATDRAFRIGQINRVMVHKFICRGTLEEKIDSLIESKVTLSHEILESADPVLLTELSNEDLMKIVTLDLHAAEELV